MDTNLGEYNDDMEEDKEDICNSIALADAQVAHTHEFFLGAIDCSIWRWMNSCTQTENQRRRLPEDEEVPPWGCCSCKGCGGTCWSSHGWLCQSLVQRGVKWRRRLKDIHFHDCLKAAFPQKRRRCWRSRVFSIYVVFQAICFELLFFVVMEVFLTTSIMGWHTH